MNPTHHLTHQTRHSTSASSRRLVVCGVAALAAATSLPDARADLIAGDLAAQNDSLVTYDTATALEWLDISTTVGLSLSAVEASPFVLQYGFRLATGEEIVSLWRNAGASGPFNYSPTTESYAGNYTAARLLVNIMGCTSAVLGVACDDEGQNWHIGRFTMPGGQGLALVDYFEPSDPRAGTGAMLVDLGSAFPSFFDRPDIGSFLVREAATVSEPSSLLLLTLAGVGPLSHALSGRNNRQHPTGSTSEARTAP